MHRRRIAAFPHDRHFSVASTGRPAPEPIPEEIVSNRAPRVAALVPAQSDLMACSKMRQTEAMGDSQFQHLRLWGSTRMRYSSIARTDRLDMHVPVRTEKYWQSGSKEFQQQADANSSCPPQNEVALESCIATLALRQEIGEFFPM